MKARWLIPLIVFVMLVIVGAWYMGHRHDECDGFRSSSAPVQGCPSPANL